MRNQSDRLEILYEIWQEKEAEIKTQSRKKNAKAEIIDIAAKLEKIPELLKKMVL